MNKRRATKHRMPLSVSLQIQLISCCCINTSISSTSLSHVRRDDVSPPIHAITAQRNDRVIATLMTEAFLEWPRSRFLVQFHC